MSDAVLAADDPREAIFHLFMRHIGRVNNWDLVDQSAAQIVGGWLRVCGEQASASASLSFPSSGSPAAAGSASSSSSAAAAAAATAAVQRTSSASIFHDAAPTLCSLPSPSDRDAFLAALANTNHLWSRRVAMIACFHFIRRGEAGEAMRVAELLVGDEHDLIHKAVGWMMREVGKRVDVDLLRGFLRKHAATMPRTMLRYSIEHLDEEERQRWLRAKDQ